MINIKNTQKRNLNLNRHAHVRTVHNFTCVRIIARNFHTQHSTEKNYMFS